MDSAVLWYRKKIGACDLQIWEKAVEIQEQKFKGIEVRHKHETSLKSDLIDVDLVRGSTFSKNKPQHHVIFILWMGFVRVLLLPFFFKWWTQQTSRITFVGFLFLYVLQFLCMFLYVNGSPENLKNVSVSEVLLPNLLMLVLGLIHCQVVSTNMTTLYQTRSSDSLLQKRTLSKALLEPAESTDYKQTLMFVNSSVRNIDFEKDNLSSTLPDNASVKDDRKDYDEDTLLEDIHDDSYASDSSSDEGSPTRLQHASSKSTYLSTTALLPGNNPSSDHINIKVWENGQWQKCDASLLHIGGIIIKKVDSLLSCSDDYFTLSVVFPVIISTVPAAHRFFQEYRTLEFSFFLVFRSILAALVGDKGIGTSIIIIGAFIERMVLTSMFFIMLCAAQQTYKKRFLYSKYFTHLTSSRRAKKSLIPHFRLNKVQNIRVWLTLRSYLRRRGPQRSVDVIVSSAFLCSVCLLCFITVHWMNSSEAFTASLIYWDSLILFLALAIFILYFITIGVKINKKYNGISTLLTEQINLHLQIEKKPHKKENLQRANGVLTLAAKLIKEIEEPYNIYGLAMNPILYNITRVLLLSAFSGVFSELLGFKFKIWKIKI